MSMTRKMTNDDNNWLDRYYCDLEFYCKLFFINMKMNRERVQISGGFGLSCRKVSIVLGLITKNHEDMNDIPSLGCFGNYDADHGL